VDLHQYLKIDFNLLTINPLTASPLTLSPLTTNPPTINLLTTTIDPRLSPPSYLETVLHASNRSLGMYYPLWVNNGIRIILFVSIVGFH